MWLELLTLSNEMTLFYHNLEMNYLNNGPFGLEKLSIVLIQFTSVHINKRNQIRPIFFGVSLFRIDFGTD